MERNIYGFPAEDYDLNDLYGKTEDELRKMAETDSNVEYVEGFEEFVHKVNADEIDSVNRVWVYAGMKKKTIYL